MDREMHLAFELDRIMRRFKNAYRFVGVASNNIYWSLTHMPIRVILIPAGKEYITLVNPMILELEGANVLSIEACGSVPGENYIVKRKSYVSVGGHTLKNEYVELEYGSKEFEGDGSPIISSHKNQEWIIQHEMDHLKGKTIMDIGEVFDLTRLMSYSPEFSSS